MPFRSFLGVLNGADDCIQLLAYCIESVYQVFDDTSIRLLPSIQISYADIQFVEILIDEIGNQGPEGIIEVIDQVFHGLAQGVCIGIGEKLGEFIELIHHQPMVLIQGSHHSTRIRRGTLRRSY